MSDSISDNKTSGSSRTKRNKASLLGRLYLVMVILLLGAVVAWSSWQLSEQRKEIDILFTSLTNAQAQAADFNENLVAYVHQSAEMEAQLREANIASTELQARIAQQEMELRRVSDQLVDVSLTQTSEGGEVSQAWRLTEVESLLGLAEQHLLMGGHSDTALTLMLSADEILQSLNDSTVYPVRSAIARDIAQLRAMPDNDAEGIYVRLAAQFNLVNELQLRDDLMGQVAEGTAVQGSSDGWLSKLGKEIGSIISIRKLDGPIDPTLTPEQNWYLKSRIMLLIEQARLAVRAQEQGIYMSALDQAIELTETYYEQNETSATLLENLQTLRSEEVVVPIPVASAGLQSVRQLIESWQRGQAESEL